MARRELDFRSIDEMIAEIERLRDRGYRREGNWTLAQVCDHLAIFFRGSLDGYDAPPAPWHVRLLAKLMLRSALKRRKFKQGVRVPNELLPGDPRDDSAAVAEFVELASRYRDSTGEPAPNPFFGRLSRDTCTQLHLIHAAHHLSFLRPNDPD